MNRGKTPLSHPWKWPVPEYNSIFTYCKGDVVWLGELQYIAKDFVTGENPDNSENCEIYVKTRR